MGASAECTYGCGSPDVFGEDNALGLNYEEVNQLVNIADDAIESLAGNSVVAARTKLARESRTNNGLAGNLSSDSDTKDNPRKLEGVSQKIQVSDGKNQGDGRGIGNRGGTCAVLSVYRLIAGCPLFRVYPKAKVGRGPGSQWMGSTYEGCSTTGARRRRSGSGSEADRWQLGCWESGEQQPGWRTHSRSSGVAP